MNTQARQIRRTLLLILCLVGLNHIVQAQNFSVSPSTLNYTAEPNQSQSLEIVLKNDANLKQTFTLSIGDWTQSQTGEILYLPAGTLPQSCSKWVKIFPPLVELQPNQSKKVKVVLSVPAGQQNSKWAMLFATPSQEQQQASAADKTINAGGAVLGRIAVPLLQSPRSNTAFKATIKNLRETKKRNKNGERVFLAEVINQGDKIIKGTLLTTLANIQTGIESELQPNEILVLPQITCTVSFALPANTPKGQHLLTRILNYSNDADLEGTQMQISVK